MFFEVHSADIKDHTFPLQRRCAGPWKAPWALRGRLSGGRRGRALGGAGGHGRGPSRCLRRHRDAGREILKRLAVTEEALKELEFSAARGDDFEEMMAVAESHFPGLETLWIKSASWGVGLQAGMETSVSS